MSKTTALVGNGNTLRKSARRKTHMSNRRHVTAVVSAPSTTTTGVATNMGVDVSAGATAGVAMNTGVVSAEAGTGKTLGADKNATTADSAMLGDSSWLL